MNALPLNDDHLEHSHRRVGFFAWLLGGAILVTLVSAVVHVSEERALVGLLGQAEPLWIVAAVLLQLATYLAQGQIWRAAARAGNVQLSPGKAYRLSLAKLFVDQALPTGGLSGATLVARSLEQLGLPRGLMMASLVVCLVSYYVAYIVCLAIALIVMTAGGHSSRLIWVVALLFACFGGVLVWVVLQLSGRRASLLRSFERLQVVKKGLDLLNQADPNVFKNPKLLMTAFLWQVCIVLLDAGSLWVLVRAMGVFAPVSGVFASFMIASLLRTVGFVPGGLGTFEAAAVFTLQATGVPLPQALSATLLFRALSFWLPMVPGVFFSKDALKRDRHATGPVGPDGYWSIDLPEVLTLLQASQQGLSTEEAHQRLLAFGPNELRDQHDHRALELVWRQLRSPLLLLLVFAGAASAVTGDWADATVVLVILLASVGIGYWREFQAATAAAALRARVQTRADVLRDGKRSSIPHREVVPGDVVELSAGSLVPADALVLEATDVFVNEALLTGESFPAEKRPGVVPLATSLSERHNCVYQGTNVRSGAARCVVVRTGASTEIGSVAHQLTLRPPQTEFDRGLLRFGYLVTTSMFVMVLLVFAMNMFLGRPPVETLLFSIALAVGMSPELLPAILSVNLARGATLMADRGVLVRRLNAIENLGSMTVLCTDKTGTLTEGVIELHGAFDPHGGSSSEVLRWASINAALQAGLVNPLDQAILRAAVPDLSGIEKIAEVPYDFVRRRLSVIVRNDQGTSIITKGAFEEVVEVCTCLRDGRLLGQLERSELAEQFRRWSIEGFRVLAVARRDLAETTTFGRHNERDLAFQGFLAFQDPPKEGAREAIADLGQLGVSVKLISGDNKLVSQYVARQVGLRAERVVTGAELLQMHDEALWAVAEDTDLFVEVDPNQKERIILALRKTGNVVGFLGDGINDAPAMHAADASISVERAADVAREAADFVLLERHLDVLRRGIEEGRTTFANTLKYVLTTMSANLGNMVSMAVASAFLPFLPLLAGQILLNNLLSDIPAIGLASDAVDQELIARPRRWDMRFIGRFMVEFGLLSSLFDFLTFAALVAYFAAPAATFRTAWFVESLLTELVVALVVRTRRPFFRSRPGKLLLISTLSVLLITFVIPYLPFASFLGFVPLPMSIAATVIGIAAMYVVVTELAKAHLYRSSFV